MSKPTKKQIKYADSVIEAMRAFKRGKPIQHRGKISTGGKWMDFDLAGFINSQHKEYRAKPI